MGYGKCGYRAELTQYSKSAPPQRKSFLPTSIPFIRQMSCAVVAWNQRFGMVNWFRNLRPSVNLKLTPSPGLPTRRTAV